MCVRDSPKCTLMDVHLFRKVSCEWGSKLCGWDATTKQPNHYQLGTKSRQYAEIAAVLINLQQVTTLEVKLFIICSDSNHAGHSFISHFPIWKENQIKNVRNKDVRNSELFLACNNLSSNHNIVVHWKKVKGHLRPLGPYKDGNDEADKNLKALPRDLAHLKLENGLLVYSHQAQGPTLWVVPIGGSF